MKDTIIIPISPRFVSLILSGEKTIELRKTAPKSKVIKEYEEQRLVYGNVFPSEISDTLKKKLKKIVENLGEDRR